MCVLCRIDSEHNLKVVGWVTGEVPPGNEYSTAEIKSERNLLCSWVCFSFEALQTYRKTLARLPKDSEHDQRLRRSRQQKVRIYFLFVCISAFDTLSSLLIYRNMKGRGDM